MLCCSEFLQHIISCSSAVVCFLGNTGEMIKLETKHIYLKTNYVTFSI